MKPQKQKTQVSFPGKKYKPMVLQVKKDSPSVVTVYQEANSNARKASIGITPYSSLKDIVRKIHWDFNQLSVFHWVGTCPCLAHVPSCCYIFQGTLGATWRNRTGCETNKHHYLKLTFNLLTSTEVCDFFSRLFFPFQKELPSNNLV